MVQPIPGAAETIHFDTKGYKEITLKVCREEDIDGLIIVDLAFYVQETEYIGLKGSGSVLWKLCTRTSV